MPTDLPLHEQTAVTQPGVEAATKLTEALTVSLVHCA